MPGLNNVHVLFREPPPPSAEVSLVRIDILWQVLVLVHVARHDSAEGHHGGDEGGGHRRRQCRRKRRLEGEARERVNRIRNFRRFQSMQSGGCKEMSFIYADQWRPWSSNAEGGGLRGSQSMRTAVHITWHGAQMNFRYLTSYLSYA
jgi:hypothetical protein